MKEKNERKHMNRSELEGKSKEELVDIILDIDERERTLWKLHQSDASVCTTEREKKNKCLKLCVFLTILVIIFLVGNFIMVFRFYKAI